MGQNVKRWQILEGDALEQLRELEPSSVDAIVTDPPYGLGFMGKAWDALPPGEATGKLMLEVAKPGAHLVAFGGTRTYHRLATALEDAGWEIRDQLAWVYGSGFPKSLDVSKAIDRKRDDVEEVRQVCRWIRASMVRAELGSRAIADSFGFNSRMVDHWAARDTDSQPTLPTWEQWERLKVLLGSSAQNAPDAEVWRLNGRKGTPGEAWDKREKVGTARGVDTSRSRLGFAGDRYGGTSESIEFDITAAATDAAKQWDGWGTALKPAWEPIVLARKPLAGTVAANVLEHRTGALNVDGCRVEGEQRPTGLKGDGSRSQKVSEGWDRPWKNDERADRVVGDGGRTTALGRWPANLVHDGSPEAVSGMGDAQRYFYTAKASSSERNAGLEGLETRLGGTRGGAEDDLSESHKRIVAAENHHPTVKPLALMRWLCRMVTPPGGLILDPFLGSGTTMMAALQEGFRCVGIEREPQYAAIARRRVEEDAPLFNRVTE